MSEKGVESEIKEKIAETLNVLYSRGYISSVGGNVSCRINDKVIITPRGKTKFSVSEEDLVETRINGELIGEGIPSSELPVHLTLYKRREDVRCVIHAHPPYTFVLSMLIDRDILENTRMTPESAIYLGRVRVIDFVVPGEEAAMAMEGVADDADIIIIKNHGVFSMGRSLEEALARLEVLEENSKLMYLTIALDVEKMGRGSKIGMYRIPEDVIKRLMETYRKK